MPATCLPDIEDLTRLSRSTPGMDEYILLCVLGHTSLDADKGIDSMDLFDYATHVAPSTTCPEGLGVFQKTQPSI